MTRTASQPEAVHPATTTPLLRASGVRKSYRMGDSDVPVLKGVDLTVREGEFLAIEGRSGSGKSTLLHVLGALETLDSGRVEFAGRDYTTLAPPVRRGWRRLIRPLSLDDWILQLTAGSVMFALGGLGGYFGGILGEHWLSLFADFLPAILCILALSFCLMLYGRRERPRAQMRNKRFGFVFQFYHLLPELSVLENTMLAPEIEFSLLAFRSRRRVIRERAMEALSTLGLAHRLKHRPNQLSGGERQRAAIARALMNNPRVLFADEPTGNLDADTGRQIMNVLEGLHRDHGQTIVMVTHDRALAREADRVLVLRDGRLEKADS